MYPDRLFSRSIGIRDKVKVVVLLSRKMTADTVLDMVGTLTTRHPDQRTIGLYLNVLPVPGNSALNISKGEQNNRRTWMESVSGFGLYVFQKLCPQT